MTAHPRDPVRRTEDQPSRQVAEDIEARDPAGGGVSSAKLGRGIRWSDLVAEMERTGASRTTKADLEAA